ncbi:MAG: hypothetical protein U9Q67_04900 [Patescibacteria group bacterium]|nr:hypothetical protein [Patescibacteria group bacterium]
MKNAHLLVFGLLAVIVIVVVYNQQKQQQVMIAMSDALDKVGEDTNEYRNETRALLSTILQVADQAELPEPQERKRVGFEYPNQA